MSKAAPSANSADFAIRLALKGAGIVIAPECLAAEKNIEGRLKVLFEGKPDDNFGLFAANSRAGTLLPWFTALLIYSRGKSWC
ncbi:hypothetical protein [Erythrobacter donghaensis]|uniref:hypothetical protein n=1 Tax=Erythrobacter donghaensis TaxID=267135 RepID=UPI00117F67C6|nr:hypothetical protein [Erythrobacter donghaensis]